MKITDSSLREENDTASLIRKMNDPDRTTQWEGLYAFSILSGSPDSRLKLIERSGVEVFVRLLFDEDRDFRIAATHSLANMAQYTESKTLIRGSRAIDRLAELLSDESSLVCTEAARALANLSEFDLLVGALSDSNPHVKIAAAQGLGNHVRANQVDHPAIVEAGAIVELVTLFSDESPRVQELAMSAIACLIENEAYRYDCVEAGVIAPLERRLSAETSEASAGPAGPVWLLILWIIGMLVQDSDERSFLRDRNQVALGESGVIEPLVRLLSDTNEMVRQNASKALKNLARDETNREAIRSALESRQHDDERSLSPRFASLFFVEEEPNEASGSYPSARAAGGGGASALRMISFK